MVFRGFLVKSSWCLSLRFASLSDSWLRFAPAFCLGRKTLPISKPGCVLCQDIVTFSLKTKLRFASRPSAFCLKIVAFCLKTKFCFASRPSAFCLKIFAFYLKTKTLLSGQRERGEHLKSIDEGPYRMGTVRETLAENTEGAPQFGLKRPRVYSDLTPEEKDRNQATVQDGRVVAQHVQGRQNRGHGVNPRGGNAAGYGGAQTRVGNVNPGQAGPGQARPMKCYNCNGGQDNAFDDDVDEQPVQDLTLNVDNVFQADDSDAFDSDVDEAPTAQTMFMPNLSSVDPVTDEPGPSYDSNILSKLHDHDHYQDATCALHEEHVMHNSVQLDHVVDSHTNYTTDSNIISYDQYVKDNEVSVVHNDVS
nr:hypothetical protein [Tanacetum cinerariifolium]